MATINRTLADELVKGNGKSKHGTAGYCLVRYENRTKYDISGVDFYNPDAEKNVFDYAIFTNKRKYEEFLNADTVGGVDILWGSERFKKDELKRVEDAEKEELLEGVSDILAEYSEEDEFIEKQNAEILKKPSRRER
jgi:hypothetical protein